MAKVIRNRDCETPFSIEGSLVRVDWYRAGEGLYGDYNPDNPDDQELLRFDVYQRDGDQWVELEDASYCTMNAVDAEDKLLIQKLNIIYICYEEALQAGSSVKKLGESLSWI